VSPLREQPGTRAPDPARAPAHDGNALSHAWPLAIPAGAEVRATPARRLYTGARGAAAGP